MRIVVNHLTRMGTPVICVAGIDLDTGRHVRPITKGGLTRNHLRENGGPFALGGIVDLGETTPNPSPPEVEDHWFWPDRARLVKMMSPEDYWSTLEGAAHDSLEDAFGSSLVRRNWKFAVDEGTGQCSLACLRAHEGSELAVDERDGREKLTLKLRHPDKPTYLSVTDLRFCEADHQTLARERIEQVAERLRAGAKAIVMLGLARAFQASGDDRPRHWLQANGICLAEDPLP